MATCRRSRRTPSPREVAGFVRQDPGRRGDHAGSISAEHGISLQKRDFLGVSRSSAEMALIRQLKAALDPHNTLDPGKVFAI